jgi:HD superfamily phosphodiesterase
MPNDNIRQIEDFARPYMVSEAGHDFKHCDRVRHWAVRIAKQEGYSGLDKVEAAALLHDIGLRDGGRRRHAEVGADLAVAFLRAQQFFDDKDIEEIANAIRLHASLNGTGRLYEILQDADCLEMLGAIGLMRAFTSKAHMPEYPPGNVKGDTWGIRADDITRRFQNGLGVGDFIIDQINFQMSCFANLHTQTARQIAIPLVGYMKAFVLQLESEISDE